MSRLRSPWEALGLAGTLFPRVPDKHAAAALSGRLSGYPDQVDGCRMIWSLGQRAEWWIGKHGPFTVPVEGQDQCEFWALRRICHANGYDPAHLDNDKPH